MVFFKQLYYFLVLILHYKLCMGYLEYDNWVNIALSHAIDHKNPNSFAYRGNITISSLEIGLAKTNQEVLTAIQIQNLEDLARANQMYRLKAEVYYADGKRQQFLSSTKACNLIMSNLNDILWISIDHNGYINAATVLTSRSDVCLLASLQLLHKRTALFPWITFSLALCRVYIYVVYQLNSSKMDQIQIHHYAQWVRSFYENISVSGLEDFNTDVLIRHTEMAPFPDTTSFIQKLEREREARERGDVRDNRGFFAKYWMYIVPVVLLVFISGATNQDNSK
ncbi:ER membrane protein complex subunit 10 isoform X1 [Zeugodacus cucurbitae]|uniref:ER membrane protein complex subunit 10 isoform X1 n=1 Tax=Zeugodacus cucurbitae TaxID=28588 RepID=UPI0023D916EC|nr:ER membrane protein complex subunit 10 isoform X1 [Zeugodacus cucurbitae]